MKPGRCFSSREFWRAFAGERKGDVGEHLLFSFLTTEANADVAPIHRKAMPVLLLDELGRETWLKGSMEEALALAAAGTR